MSAMSCMWQHYGDPQRVALAKCYCFVVPLVCSLTWTKGSRSDASEPSVSPHVRRLQGVCNHRKHRSNNLITEPSLHHTHDGNMIWTLVRKMLFIYNTGLWVLAFILNNDGTGLTKWNSVVWEQCFKEKKCSGVGSCKHLIDHTDLK